MINIIKEADKVGRGTEKIKVAVYVWDKEWGDWIEVYSLVGRSTEAKVTEKLDKIFKNFEPEEQ